ncbi:hypothetical protein B0H66DRAFT_248120 [Apodospora peruviana]|uniref:AAA+ ATPase domain-containing protein n=1 Tax=Apodospora peruviana TaxID=516989 RepID=A0AAE0I5D1_9PEZI|nr:hypothetical protein B0H66DRAFT_248120 [Apodospora peruviana]
MRIRNLEEQLLQLEEAVRGMPSDFRVKRKKKKFEVHRHSIQRSSIGQFRITARYFDVPVEQRPAIELLVADPMVKSAASGDFGPPARRTTGLDDATGSPQVPERIRIRSRQLIAHFDRLVRGDMSKLTQEFENKGRTEHSPVLFLRPFKFFTTYEKQIRDSVQEVQDLINREAEELAAMDEEARRKFDHDREYNNQDLLEDLKLLVMVLDTDLKPVFDLRHHIRNATLTEIEYLDLWHLFERGDYVISKSSPDFAYRVVNYTGGRDILVDRTGKEENDKARRNARVDGFLVECFSLTYNGSDYVPTLKKISIRKFRGRQPISSLPVYPLKFDPNAHYVRKRLIEQGNQYLDLTCSPFCHRVLTGETLDEPSHNVDGQVIVDVSLAVNNMVEWRPKTNIAEDELTLGDERETHEPSYCSHDRSLEGCCGADRIQKDLEMDKLDLNSYLRDHGRLLGPRRVDEISEDERVILPHCIHGFVLRSRQWVTLRTADLSEVKFENEFDDLILPEKHKRTVQALVQTHESARTKSAGSATVASALDLVKGKGAGLILLLHGEPGVGKTLTAECVADVTKRPLYPITCGDIGETAMEVEKNLQYNFKLAHKWGCVLLLDEADVFLAKRNKTDLRRNAVTSVFLRSLEYYAGILFLTTNRVGSIDPAFKSRIHMSLFYPHIDLETTLRLYEVFIRRTKEEQERSGSFLFKINQKQLLRFAERHFRKLEKRGLGTWNGRQIRNAFQTAIALAEHESQQSEPSEPRPVLGKRQFHIVADGSEEFDHYLYQTLGAIDSDIASREQLRSDRFTSGGGQSTQMSSATTSTSKPAYQMVRVNAQRTKNRESTDESDEDSDDDNSDEESDDESLSMRGLIVPGVAGGRSSALGRQGRAKNSPTTGSIEEYEEYLRQKRNKK